MYRLNNPFLLTSLALFWVCLSFTSCVQYKNLPYFQSSSSDTLLLAPQVQEAYQVRPYDILQVQLNALDESTSDFLKGGRQNQAALQRGVEQLYLSGFMVNEQGAIDLPMLGKVQVAGKTTDQIGDMLEAELGEYLKFSHISVKLTNFRVTVTGEVTRPGVQYVYEKQYTLMQALANAGHTTQFAKLKRVKLIRVESKGFKVHHLDLTDPASLSSEYMFMRPGDVVYIEPIKASAIVTNSRIITVVSSILSLALVILNLTNN